MGDSEEARMNRLAIAFAVGLLVAWSVGVGATTVDHRWSGDTYVLRAYDIDDAPANGFLLSTFFIVNEGKWEIVRDTVNDAIVFATGSFSALEDADIEVSFTPFVELELKIPSRFVDEGDKISVYLMWLDDEKPYAFFTVEEGRPEEAEAAAGSPGLLPAPFAVFRALPVPFQLRATTAYEADDGVAAVIANAGGTIFRGDLALTATLSYFRDWIGESVTKYFEQALGSIVLAPGAKLQLTVRPDAAVDGSVAVTFPDIVSRDGKVLTIAIPAPSEKAIAAFREMITNVWTGVSDKEPDTDYIDLGFGVPGLHILVPITPYFPPPR
jgi:hypothetical protein